MKGTLAEGVLPGVLRELYVGRKSGLLHFSHGGLRRSVQFRRGNIIHAVSSFREEHLGETLVRHGLLKAEGLEQATAIVVGEKKRLGDALLQLGLMDRDRLQDAIAVHVREILLKAFASGDGTYEFEELDEASLPIDLDVTLKLSTGEVILEAVRHISDADAVRHALGDLDRVLAPSTDPLLRFQKVALTPADGYILSRIDGTLSMREITQLIPMVREDVERSIFGLLCTGLVELVPGSGPRPARAQATRTSAVPTVTPRPAEGPSPAAVSLPSPAVSTAPRAAAPAPPKLSPEDEHKEVEARRKEVMDAYEGLRSKNHFEILGIPKASNEGQVKDAYFRLARRFHPDVHHDRALADLAVKLEAVFIRLGEAYEVLRNPNSRSTYEADLAARAPRPRPTASSAAHENAHARDPELEAHANQEAVRNAAKLFEEEKYWDVIQLLEPRVPHLEKKLLSHARLLLGRSYAKNPNWIRQAERALKEASEADPTSAEPYVALARLYRDQGLKSRAAAMYRKVLDLRPDNEEAAKALADSVPEEPPPEPRGGILKKLFGRS